MIRHELPRYAGSAEVVISALIIDPESCLKPRRREIINALIKRQKKRAEPPGRCIFKTQK